MELAVGCILIPVTQRMEIQRTMFHSAHESIKAQNYDRIEHGNELS